MALGGAAFRGMTCGGGRDSRGVFVEAFVLTSGGDGDADESEGVDARDLGALTLDDAAGLAEGVVNVLSRFSFSCRMVSAGGSSSSCSILLFLGLKTGEGWIVGSRGLAIEACRCSSIIPRGALTMVLAVGFFLRAIS